MISDQLETPTSLKAASLTLFTTLAVALTAQAKLVAWFPLDETPGSSELVAEIAGNSNAAGTIGYDPDDPEFSFLTKGHPSPRPNLGTSYLFTKGSGVELGDDDAVQPTDKFTISFWFQPLTLDAFDRFFESQVTNTNAQDGIRIDMGSGSRVRVLIRDNNGATNSQFNHPITLRNDGTWYFFAFRYDSEGIDNAPFQLTVLEVAEGDVDEAMITAATSGPATLNTGSIHRPHAGASLIGVENPGATGGNNLHAAMDEIAFYDNSDGNGVLSDAQLADVYNFGPSGVELIKSFTTDITSVSPGNPATLSWETVDSVDTLVLDDGLGNMTDLLPLTNDGEGTIEVTPEETTTYRLIAIQGDASNTHTIKVIAGAAPEIGSFNASKELVKAGETLDLAWSVTGADSLSLDPGGEDVSEMNTITVAPEENTTYTLSATNEFGTSTAQVTVSVITGPVPTHRYVASHPENDDLKWVDAVGGKDWALNGAAPEELLVPSPNTNITATYFTGGGLTGGTAGSFQFQEFTAEIWLRPGEDLGADHEVIFESGGGQNGLAAMITRDGFRFLGSAGDVRNLDLVVPMGNLVLDDFVQVVFSNSAANDTFDVSIRDVFGNVRTASESADVIIGGNGAALFAYGSGGLGGDNNLGGRTEAADVNPEGLTGFAGEIAIVNLYDRLLDTAEIEQAFAAVATSVGTPPPPFQITEVVLDQENNTLQLTWDSVPGNTYGAQFSTDLEEWFDFAGPFEATSEQTTETLNVPPNQPAFYVRIGEL